MPREPREPQSYGSGEDWVAGRTGQQVNDPKSAPAPEHQAFYDDRRESETTGPEQGGKPAEQQTAGRAEPHSQPGDPHAPVSKVTAAEGGAKRGGFFKKRDYE